MTHQIKLAFLTMCSQRFKRQTWGGMSQHEVHCVYVMAAILFYSILFYSILFYSILFYSILFFMDNLDLK
jgi:Mg2+/citrate symporter